MSDSLLDAFDVGQQREARHVVGSQQFRAMRVHMIGGVLVCLLACLAQAAFNSRLNTGNG